MLRLIFAAATAFALALLTALWAGLERPREVLSPLLEEARSRAQEMARAAVAPRGEDGSRPGRGAGGGASGTPAAPREPGPAGSTGAASPAAPAPAPPHPPPTTPAAPAPRAPAVPPPGLGPEVEESIVSSGSRPFREGPLPPLAAGDIAPEQAPTPGPSDPELSTHLVRRMLALYERVGERR